MEIIVVFLLLLFVSLSHGYHLSLNTFQWQYAEIYCRQHCNSHLASIHSDVSYQEIIELVTNFGVETQSFWIGLEQVTPGQFIWTDGTPFDFGNNTNPVGQYPWRCCGEPDADLYLTLFGGQNLRWRLVTSFTTNYAICNSCDNVLTKYIIYDDTKNDYSTTNSLCQSDYNTEIASIHSDNDMKEVTILCNITNIENNDNDDCLFGLGYNANMFTYQATDGTEIDYPTNILQSSYPWCPNEPSFIGVNPTCIAINASNTNGCWQGVDCFTGKYSFCNMKSELCFQQEWNLVRGTTWNFIQHPCELINEYNDINIAMIEKRQFDNNGEAIKIELQYNINYNTTYTYTDGADGGIILLLNTSCNQYYYIGISSDSKVFLAEISNDIYYNIIIERSLNFTYEIGTFYSIRIELINGVDFSIYVNNINYISNYYTNRFNNSNSGNTLSGYIGIRNTNSSLNAKSLFVSGKIIWNITSSTMQLPIFIQCLLPTEMPTLNPTNNPANQPTTAVPTFNPVTIAPTTSIPTFNPTDPPVPTTVITTMNPTTNVPTKSPITTFPSTSPTTAIPTINPIIKSTETKELTTESSSANYGLTEDVSYAVPIYALIIGLSCCIMICIFGCVNQRTEICQKHYYTKNSKNNDAIELEKVNITGASKQNVQDQKGITRYNSSDINDDLNNNSDEDVLDGTTLR